MYLRKQSKAVLHSINTTTTTVHVIESCKYDREVCGGGFNMVNRNMDVYPRHLNTKLLWVHSYNRHVHINIRRVNIMFYITLYNI